MAITTNSALRRSGALTTASIIALGLSMPAMAQDAPAQGDEEVVPEDAIVVTGFRASLESAQNIKRDADTVVDVITAEDIGALPDRSVAESLQRIPGVNISRFAGRDDPDRFSVEGSGVIIRGLPFVRSELNGRDIFSANGGRTLGFNDISPELLGRIEVYKNVTADMVDGGIAGTVNLVTRKPLDRPGLRLAGTVEANVGDLANEWSPGFSVLGSNTFDTPVGTFGLQLGYAQQELITRTDASQITDPCYRPAALDAGCIRVRPVGSGGFSGDAAFDETNFPPANSVIVPKGAGVRTTTLGRDRQAYSAVAQFESSDGRFQITGEYLRAETQDSLEEFAQLALVNNDAFFPVPVPGSSFTYDGNVFVKGVMTQISDGGIPGISTENLRFAQEGDAYTEDFSLDMKFELTDRLRTSFEMQYVASDRNSAGIITAMQTYADIAIDNSGNTPSVQFLRPGTSGSPASYFTDPALTYFWFNLDNQVANEGSMYTLRGDVEYDVSDEGFVRKARFGARWGERSRVTRNANFSNWSNLGAPWTGRGGNWNCGDFQAYGCGGAYAFDFPDNADVFSPFGNNFQRGAVPAPTEGGQAIYFGGDDLVARYLSGELGDDLQAIRDFTLTPEGRPLIDGRTYVDPVSGNATACDPFCPPEIIPIEETTNAAYARLDFGHDFSSGATLDGNIGLRYVQTRVRSQGLLGFMQASYVDAPVYADPNDPTSANFGGDGDGVAEVSDIANRCAFVTGPTTPGYCSLSAARRQEFVDGLTGDIFTDFANETYDHWLPSFNVRLDTGTGFVVRAAVSKGIFRPDLDQFRTGGLVSDNTLNLVNAGTEDTGPLFTLSTGNRQLRPTQSWNYDLSAEWYFSRVGSLTAAVFMKQVSSLENPGATVQPISSPDGNQIEVLINGPVNVDEGTLKGAELAYQQTYDFLPGALSGLGSQLTYTYVDGGEFTNSTLGAEQSPFAGGLPLAGISKHTINAVLFYEKYGFSARAAYNWRSEFLQTPRDVIFPFSPIYGEATGQLDASIFYDVTDSIKVGVQGVNLLDEVTRTSQVFDFDGTRVIRSAFRNDRRFTFLVRFDF